MSAITRQTRRNAKKYNDGTIKTPFNYPFTCYPTPDGHRLSPRWSVLSQGDSLRIPTTLDCC